MNSLRTRAVVIALLLTAGAPFVSAATGAAGAAGSAWATGTAGAIGVTGTARVMGGAVAAQSPAVPSPSDVLGWSLGERFSDVHAVQSYFGHLAEVSPLVSVEEYGRTVEQRPLLQVLIATPEHRERLEQILADNRRLTDPELPEAEASAIIERNPAVVYFSYGVHGNESSSSEAAMWTAWDLARGADEVASVLDSVIVIIDPVVNPDGRDRYVSFYRSVRGPRANPDPRTREHDEPWPGGRTNHYYFDLNRDWAWGSQPETRARLGTWHHWTPQVHVDFHEMSPNSNYFFFPPAAPINPLYPEHTARWARRIGEANAAAFSREGWLFFTEESYDLFYPGYGDSWPSLLGAIGMTYEQAGGGSAGLAYQRRDGDVLTLRDRATHHRVAGQATLRSVAEGRADLLEGFAAFHRRIDEGLDDILLIPGSAAPGRLHALLGELELQGIDYEVAADEFSALAEAHAGWSARRRFPAGTVRVPARQPRGRLAATLLTQGIPLEAAYSYDISAWSRPYAYGVEAHAAPATELRGIDWLPADHGPVWGGGSTLAHRGVEATDPGSSDRANTRNVADARVDYGVLVLPRLDAYPALVRFLSQGGRGRIMADTFRIDGRLFPRGTVFLPAALNPALSERLATAGLTSGDGVAAVHSAWTETGPDLGTGGAGELRLPRVALVGGERTNSNSFGAHRFFLDHRLELEHDVILASELEDGLLDRWDVIVVPDGRRVGRELGDAGRRALGEWLRRGGTLVAVAGGAAGLEGVSGVELREARRTDDPGATARALQTVEERELARWEDRTPGAILEAEIDPGHPLAFGAAAPGGDRLFVLSSGNGFEPSESFASAAWFAADLQGVSGVVSETTLERLSESSWLVERSMGRGRIVLFADDPLFRMMWATGSHLYANALLFAPAF